MKLVASQSIEFLSEFVGQIMEIPIRVILSYTNFKEKQKQMGDSTAALANLITSDIHAKADSSLESLSYEENKNLQYLLATELLGELEKQLPSDLYLTYYSKIQMFLQQIKLEKKSNKKIEAITDPKAYAEKKVSSSFPICRFLTHLIVSVCSH
jgi:hypothetical protein